MTEWHGLLMTLLSLPHGGVGHFVPAAHQGELDMIAAIGRLSNELQFNTRATYLQELNNIMEPLSMDDI
jgi:hypothetical protein